MSTGLQRVLNLWRVLVACALLAVGTPGAAAVSPAPAPTEEVQRTSITARVAVPQQQPLPTTVEPPQARAPVVPTHAPVPRVDRVDHLHLKLCILLC